MTAKAATNFEGERPSVRRGAPNVSRAMVALEQEIELDPVVRELVELRASILNGCAYCIDMHTKRARRAGESEQRLYALAAWHDAPFFTERERAALAFTESVTLVATTHVPVEDYDAVAAHWSPDEVGALLSLIVTINAWNALAVATRAWEPVLDA
jgi:AhpD family alkylhydroperoxidase